MKRDMDLARKILFEVEKAPFTVSEVVSGIQLRFPEYTEEQLAFHIMLLADAGLIHAVHGGSGAIYTWRPTSLTWAGCEFLDAARDDKRWERAKNAMSQVGGFVFEVGKQLLIEYMKAQLHAGTF